MVAILVLSIGLIAVLRTVDQSGRAVLQENARFLARNVAQNRAGQLQLLGMSQASTLPATVEMGRTIWTVQTTGEVTAGGFQKVTITVTGDGQPGAVLVAYPPMAVIR
jgi:general secretion pathway protein I